MFLRDEDDNEKNSSQDALDSDNNRFGSVDKYRRRYKDLRDSEFAEASRGLVDHNEAMAELRERNGLEEHDENDLVRYYPSPANALRRSRKDSPVNRFVLPVYDPEHKVTPMDLAVEDDISLEKEEDKEDDSEKILDNMLLDENEHDELPSETHLRVEEHRVKREYNRVAAWEMPELRAQSVPFAPSDEVFVFRYSSYMGQTHRGEAKIVVEAQASAIAKKYFGSDAKLAAKRLHKLKLLCGPRYDPSTGAVHISSESFPNSVQNKKYLVDTLKRLLIEAYDLEKDDFADLPLDRRHAKTKRRMPAFPKEWERPQDALEI